MYSFRSTESGCINLYAPKPIVSICLSSTLTLSLQESLKFIMLNSTLHSTLANATYSAALGYQPEPPFYASTF